MPASRDSQILEVVRTRPNPGSKLIQGITHIPVPLINRRMARMRKPGILAGRMVVLAALVSSGCGRKAAPPAAQGDGDHATTATSVVAMNQPGTPGYIPPAESQVFVVNGQIDLAALTTALSAQGPERTRDQQVSNKLARTACRPKVCHRPDLS